MAILLAAKIQQRMYGFFTSDSQLCRVPFIFGTVNMTFSNSRMIIHVETIVHPMTA